VLVNLGLSYEIILVNDGSTDGSWERMIALGSADACLKAVRLSRNFGHQMAITAGVHASSGAAVVVMDGDLQDPPEVIPSCTASSKKGSTSCTRSAAAARVRPRGNE
jgi:dolichol-phosphate mannosyltransferase